MISDQKWGEKRGDDVGVGVLNMLPGAIGHLVSAWVDLIEHLLRARVTSWGEVSVASWISIGWGAGSEFRNRKKSVARAVFSSKVVAAAGKEARVSLLFGFLTL
jgi:hypothetical protein